MGNMQLYAPKGAEYGRDPNKMSSLLDIDLVDQCNWSQ